MNEQLVNKILEEMKIYYKDIEYSKLVVRVRSKHCTYDMYESLKLLDGYVMGYDIVKKYNLSASMHQKMSRTLIRQISSGTEGDFETVIIYGGSDIIIEDSEVFDRENELRDRALWQYKYLGIDMSILKDEDRKNISQQII